eukprot:Nitzschia sp. Nitz4//scaffold48_size128905//104131//108028//NITZ4_003617-RA/size128905-augustus-gene-0.28-mRNA-1//-1//CDS//3329553033//5881//frame0
MSEAENTVEPGNVPETEDSMSVVVENSETSLDADPVFLDSQLIDSAKAWSEALQSPPDVAAFSPSLDTRSSYHGIGVRMATERSKSVAKFGIRTASYLSDMADAYGAIGETLTKGVKNIQPQLVKLPKTIESQADACVESVQEFGKNATSRAKHYKKTIVSPLHNYLAAKEAAVDTNSIRYDAARMQSQEARKRAMTARSKCKKAIRDAEKALNQWKKSRIDSEPVASAEHPSPVTTPQESDHVWESVLREYGSSVPEETELLIQRLKETQVAKTRYEELVLSENVAVAHAQKIEAAALDEILQVENSHVKYFFESVVKPIFKIEKGNIQLYSSRSEILESNLLLGETAALDLRKGKELLSNIFTRPTQAYEEGQAVMSAETLGLPAESGKLRDRVKTQIAQVESEIKVIQLLSELLGSLHSGVTELEIGLKLNSNEMQAQGIGDAAADSIGPLAGQLWKDVSSIYESEANAASSVSSKLDQAKSLVSDIVMESVQREVRKESEKDDYNWKMLCESARLETKAASRYRQTKATHDRARERVQSVDTTKSDEGSEDFGSGHQKTRMSKALFAGGEAMKKLQENARIAMAKSSLSEAEQNEAKEQQALDISTAAKSQAVEDYKRVTQARIDKLNGFLQERKNDVCTLTLTILSALEELDQQRLKVVQTLEASTTTYETLLKDVEAWVATSTETIKYSTNKVPQVKAGKDEEELVFQLEVQSVESEAIQWVFSQLKVETPAPAFLTEIDDDVLTVSRSESEDGGELVEDPPMIATVPSRSPSAPLTSTNGDIDHQETKFSPHTALNSLSIPVLKHSASAQKPPSAEKKSTTNKSSPNMKAFVSQFFPDKTEVPTVHQVITCAYKPREKGGFLVPNIHGRVYTTDIHLYFLAWDGKNFVLSWSDMISISKEKGFISGMDNALCVTYNNTQSGESSFILSRLTARDSVLRHFQDLHRSIHQDVEPVAQTLAVSDDRPPVPPDELMQQMSIVIANPIRNVSIREVYEKVWSEGVNTNEKPFYRPWLEAEECFDIEVGDWEFAEPGSEGFVNPWCQRKYTQKRVVLFKFKRTTHLYIGPPIAGVRQVQYCAVEGDDKCVVQISVTFDGIPYSDTFAVEMRWVARRVEGGDVFVEVGLDVDFKKSTMLKSQIRSGTIAETKNVHLRMFEAAKVACSSPGTLQLQEPEDETEPEVTTKSPITAGLLSRIMGVFKSVPVDPGFLFLAGALVSYPILWNVFASLLGAPAISVNEARALNNRIDQLQEEIHGLRLSLDVAIELLKKRS